MKHFVVFTDLDGTLIDHDTYDFAAAQPTLHLLHEKSIPVILCTSKTRSETEKIRKKMSITDPFIVENGAAIFVPKETLMCQGEGFIEKGDYLVREIGTSYATILRLWKNAKDQEGFQMKGFSEMSHEEIAFHTGLSLDEAQLAADREYSEPFVFNDRPESLRRLQQHFAKKGLQVTKGGRFFHLVGKNDKGKAVRLLTELYKRTYPYREFTTIGLGDSANDIPMLQCVHIPIVIKKKYGDWERIQEIPQVVYSVKSGPAGWAEEILRVLA